MRAPYLGLLILKRVQPLLRSEAHRGHAEIVQLVPQEGVVFGQRLVLAPEVFKPCHTERMFCVQARKLSTHAAAYFSSVRFHSSHWSALRMVDVI